MGAGLLGLFSLSPLIGWLAKITQPFNPPRWDHIPWQHFDTRKFTDGRLYRIKFDYKADYTFTPEDLPLTMFTDDNGKSWKIKMDKMPVPMIDFDNVSLVMENSL